jgi:hypothetical protein
VGGGCLSNSFWGVRWMDGWMDGRVCVYAAHHFFFLCFGGILFFSCTVKE